MASPTLLDRLLADGAACVARTAGTLARSAAMLARIDDVTRLRPPRPDRIASVLRERGFPSLDAWNRRGDRPSDDLR